MKILIIGEARHGKDTVAEIMRDEYGMTFQSSSHFVCEKAVFPYMSAKYGYKTIEECYEDRIHHRQEWYNLITAYNENNRSRLAEELLEEHDIYVGMRNLEELEACVRKGLFDIVIWVDAYDRLGTKEDSSSNTITRDYADISIDNNGTMSDLHYAVYETMRFIKLCMEM